MAKWTPAQEKAIQSPSRQIICSAAAGSGKTAVMIERIVRMIREGAEQDSFLIVTFTNAAAAEMKQKIKNRLLQDHQDPIIRAALDQMDMMQISTIHAFCQQLIRNHFQMLEIDPDFQICDTSQSKTLFHEAFSEVCDQLSMEQNSQYDLFRQRFDSKDAEKMLQDLDHFISSLPDPFGWIEKQIENIPERMEKDHPWFHMIQEMSMEHLYMAELSLSKMNEMFSESYAIDNYRNTWKADAELFHVKQSQVKNAQIVSEKTTFARSNTPRGLTIQESDWKDRYQKLRKDWKEQIEELDRLRMADPEQTILEWQNMKESLSAVQLILRRTEELYRRKKKARSLADFSDLEQYAVEILSSPVGQEEAHDTWRYIFVDECQDISAVQNQIIHLLESPENRLFMVGDVKQSIYRFRLADPLLFMDRIQKCENGMDEDRESIFLQTNFRSRSEILETTNQIFRSVMKASATEIEYGDAEALIPGRETEGFDPVILAKLDKGDRDLSDLEATADFLCQEINHLLQTPCGELKRNYQYRDCVILMPVVHPDGSRIAEMMTERGIPVFYDGSGDYYQMQEIQLVRNLLEWIDDPRQDLPLISILTQPPFSFSEENLSQIRLAFPEKEISFHEAFERYAAEKENELAEKCNLVKTKLSSWQDLAETMRVPELIWRLYQETGLYYILSAEPDGENKLANLRMLVQQASQGEERGILTLRQFLNYMKEQQSFGDQQSATLLGDQDNLVRIMTIHKSKGLQFPVVFCAGMDKNPIRANKDEILCHSSLGLCMDYKDPTHRISRPTLATEIFLWKKKREEMAEKVRLLYVAMTRAQEKLYMITCQDVNPLWSMPEGNVRILSAKSYTDWWMPPLISAKNVSLSTSYPQLEKPYEIRVFECNQQKTVEKYTDFHSLSNWLKSVVSAPVVDEMWKKSETVEKSDTLVKRSVTSLVRSARSTLMEEEDLTEETAEGKRMPDQLVRKLLNTEIPETPGFLREEGKITAAWRGTMTHRLLSQMDLNALREGKDPEEILEREMARMLREHMVSEAEMAQIRKAQILSFWRGETGQRLLRSPEVYREWNFNLLINRDKKMIVQGVIDCVFREGDAWVILDYKTDRGKTAEELREEYRPQLMWYVRAVSELTGQRVKEAALYSLVLDEWIPVMEEQRGLGKRN